MGAVAQWVSLLSPLPRGWEKGPFSQYLDAECFSWNTEGAKGWAEPTPLSKIGVVKTSFVTLKKRLSWVSVVVSEPSSSGPEGATGA